MLIAPVVVRPAPVALIVPLLQVVFPLSVIADVVFNVAPLSVRLPLTVEVPLMVRVPPERTRFSWHDRLLIVSVVELCVIVMFPGTSIVTSSLAPGRTLPLQFAASCQLSVPAPPSQETALSIARIWRTSAETGSPRSWSFSRYRNRRGRFGFRNRLSPKRKLKRNASPQTFRLQEQASSTQDWISLLKRWRFTQRETPVDSQRKDRHMMSPFTPRKAHEIRTLTRRAE